MNLHNENIFKNLDSDNISNLDYNNYRIEFKESILKDNFDKDDNIHDVVVYEKKTRIEEKTKEKMIKYKMNIDNMKKIIAKYNLNKTFTIPIFVKLIYILFNLDFIQSSIDTEQSSFDTEQSSIDTDQSSNHTVHDSLKKALDKLKSKSFENIYSYIKNNIVEITNEDDTIFSLHIILKDNTIINQKLNEFLELNLEKIYKTYKNITKKIISNINNIFKDEYIKTKNTEDKDIEYIYIYFLYEMLYSYIDNTKSNMGSDELQNLLCIIIHRLLHFKNFIDKIIPLLNDEASYIDNMYNYIINEKKKS